jgi:hypothetical protein
MVIKIDLTKGNEQGNILEYMDNNTFYFLKIQKNDEI